MEKTFMERKMKKIGPDQKQGFTSCCRSVAGRTREWAEKVTVGEVVR